MALGSGQKIYVTSPDGTRRRRLPESQITGADGLLSRYAGFANFTLNTAVPFRGDALPTILKGDRVEMYYRGVLRFRGWIEERTRTEGEPDTLSFVGYGLAFLVGQQLCIGRYTYAGSGEDIGSVFGEIVRDATVSRNQTTPGAVGRQGMALYDALSPGLLGTTTTFVDAYQKLLRDVINDLVQNQAGNLAHWGGDVDQYGQNRLYLRPLAATTFPPTHTILIPSRRTIAGQAEDQSGDLKNRVLMTGGQPRFPQLLHNGGFDLPATFQTGDSGLITDGDFENVTWTLGGGASYKDGGHQEGQPFSGAVMVELDNAGESVQKSSTFATAPVAGHSYVFSVRAKKEVGLQTANGSGYLQVKDSGGTVLLTVPLTLAPAGTAWDYFSATFAMPAGANKWTAHFQADHVSSYLGDTGGLLIDAVSLEDASVVYQDGWQTHVYGAATFNAVNWAYKDCAYDGLYCVYLNVTAADSDNHDAHLEPLNRATVPLAFKQTVRFGLRYRSPLVPTAGLGIPKFRLVLDWFRSDGSYISHSLVTVNAQAANSTWQYAEIVGTPPSDAASCCPVFNPRGSGEVLVDCLSVQDAEAVAAGDVPAAPDGHPGFQPEGSLIAVQTASGTGLGGAYASSEATYGSRWEVFSEGGVNTLGGLTQVANARLRNTALPLTRPGVTRIEDPTVYWPGDSLSLQGAHGQVLSGGQILTIVEVRLQWGDLFTATLGVDKESPDQTLEVKRLIQDQLHANGPGGAQGAGGAGGGYTNSTNFGGGITGGSGGAGGFTLSDGTTQISGVTTLNLTGGTIIADANPGTADLTITASDHKVINDSSDPTPDYLAAKLESSATLAWSQDALTHAMIGTVPKATSTAFGVVMTDVTAGSPVVYLKTTVDTLLAGKVGTGDGRLTDARTPTGTTGGDLSGTYPNPGVAKIQGRAVSATAPTDGYVLTWVAADSAWEPKAPSAAGATALSGLSDVALSSPASGQVLTFDGSHWVNATPTTGGGGVLLNGTAPITAAAARYDVWTGSGSALFPDVTGPYHAVFILVATGQSVVYSGYSYEQFINIAGGGAGTSTTFNGPCSAVAVWDGSYWRIANLS